MIHKLARPIFLICIVEAQLAADRHLQRGIDDASREFYHGDRRVAIYKATGVMSSPSDYQPPDLDVPTMNVSTQNGYTPGLEEIAEFIQASTVQPGGEPDAPTGAGDF